MLIGPKPIIWTHSVDPKGVTLIQSFLSFYCFLLPYYGIRAWLGCVIFNKGRETLCLPISCIKDAIWCFFCQILVVRSTKEAVWSLFFCTSFFLYLSCIHYFFNMGYRFWCFQPYDCCCTKSSKHQTLCRKWTYYGCQWPPFAHFRRWVFGLYRSTTMSSKIFQCLFCSKSICKLISVGQLVDSGYSQHSPIFIFWLCGMGVANWEGDWAGE